MIVVVVPGHLPEDIAAVWAEIAPDLDANAIKRMRPQFEAFCGQVVRLRDAQKRIREEGLIVPDSKDNPVPHPALVIERQAQDEIRKWGDRFSPGAAETGSEGW